MVRRGRILVLVGESRPDYWAHSNDVYRDGRGVSVLVRIVSEFAEFMIFS